MVKKTKTVKKTATKPVSKKKDTKKSVSPRPISKSKLGHDPLSWINGEDAQELGISFDDIQSDEMQMIKQAAPLLPDIDCDNAESDELELNVAEVNNVSKDSTVSAEPEDQGWGLFDDDISVAPVIEAKSEVISDDGVWGLFADDDTEAQNFPLGEGVAWGLFEESDQAHDSTIDGSAQIIHLPGVFNVASMDKIYHEFERLINEDHDVIVDASETEVIDACGLQLLYAAQKELQKRNCKLVMKDASENIFLLSRSSFVNEILGINR